MPGNVHVEDGRREPARTRVISYRPAGLLSHPSLMYLYGRVLPPKPHWPFPSSRAFPVPIIGWFRNRGIPESATKTRRKCPGTRPLSRADESIIDNRCFPFRGKRIEDDHVRSVFKSLVASLIPCAGCQESFNRSDAGTKALVGRDAGSEAYPGAVPRGTAARGS